MKLKIIKPFIALFLTVLLTSFCFSLIAENNQTLRIDKALCEKMIRFGDEFYQRGKYLDAKEHYRKAIAADPGSKVAWKKYDQAILHALAEKTEQKNDLLTPVKSQDKKTPAQGVSVEPAESEEEEFEGC